LGGYESLREQRGSWQAKLDSITQLEIELQELATRKQQLQTDITTKSYIAESQAELVQIETQLQATAYNEQSHALARGDVDKLRWAEIKQAQIKDAERKQQQSIERKHSLDLKVTKLGGSILELETSSELKLELQQLEIAIAQLAYDRAYHTQITTNLRQTQTVQLQHQEIQQAKQIYPQTLDRIKTLETNELQCLDHRKQAQVEIDRIGIEMDQIPDTDLQIESLEQQLTERRQQLDTNLSVLGRLEQQLTQLNTIQAQLQSQQQQLETYKQQQKVYDELGKAFGKNGIQALIIENILPQLEAESNQILSKLSNNQFHVQFITQKATKASRTKKSSIKNAKFIDTLDISIGDANGTRSYETYSGGESFRINFSIRLALAKLLSQRAGTPLQMLIVDEGFGTQDREGCDRLIAAINAISADFACILAVTHMPQFREAFQTRIEVQKTSSGSKIQVIT
jgi:DNA repair protein SbcC/Rad50